MEKLPRHRAEPESLEQLLRDCARMAPHWPAPLSGERPVDTAGAGPATRAPAALPAPRGVRVPLRSARLVEGMPEFGY